MEIIETVRKQAQCETVTCGSVLRELDISQSTFSHHISELVDAGILSARREGKFMHLSVDEKMAAEYLSELQYKLLSKD